MPATLLRLPRRPHTQRTVRVLRDDVLELLAALHFDWLPPETKAAYDRLLQALEPQRRTS